MSHYVIGDIHGCFDEFQTMLEKISLREEDTLFLVGDYVDRGPKSYEMLRWLEKRPAGVIALRGNHDEEFAAYTDLMRDAGVRAGLTSSLTENPDAVALYDSTVFLLRANGLPVKMFFDVYHTIDRLLKEKDATLSDLYAWAAMLRAMPYAAGVIAGGEPWVITHAGWKEEKKKKERGNADRREEKKGPEEGRSGPEGREGRTVLLGEELSASQKEFCLYARRDAYMDGGLRGGNVIAGHTPTVTDPSLFTGIGLPAPRPGEIYRYRDEKKDCTFWNMDAGCVFRKSEPEARLACLRLEDKEGFYV